MVRKSAAFDASGFYEDPHRNSMITNQKGLATRSSPLAPLRSFWGLELRGAPFAEPSLRSVERRVVGREGFEPPKA